MGCVLTAPPIGHISLWAADALIRAAIFRIDYFGSFPARAPSNCPQRRSSLPDRLRNLLALDDCVAVEHFHV